MVVTPRIKVDKTYIYGEWEPISYVGPLVEVKWNQGYPFNMKMDYVTWNGYTAQMSVGCTVIAAAQMMSSNRHPMSAPGDSATYPWNNLKLVSNYLNMKNYFLIIRMLCLYRKKVNMLINLQMFSTILVNVLMSFFMREEQGLQ